MAINKKRAQALTASVAENHVAPFVVAARTNSVKGVETSSFHCNHCSATFAANKGLTPFCVNCGSSEVDDEPSVQAEQPSDDLDMSSVECTSCSAKTILTEQTARLMGSSLHCVVCNANIHYIGASDDLDDLDVTATDDLDDDDDLGGDGLDAEGDGGDAVGSGDEDYDGTGGPDLEDSVEEGDEEAGVDEDGDDSSEGDLDTVQSSDEDPSPNDLQEDEFDKIDGQDVVGDSGLQGVEYSMAKRIGNTVDFAYAGSKLWAFSNGVPVASLEQVSAGSNSDVFFTKAFVDALGASVTRIGAKKTLAAFKFKTLAIRMQVPKVVQDLATKQTSSLTKELSAAQASLRDKFVQCLSIAASGLNKGVFRSQAGHPIKAALYDQLSSLGVRPAAKVIDTVFSNTGDKYNKMLIEKAMELMSKPADVLQSLAETVDENSYLPVPSEDEDDEGSDGTSLESAATVVSASVAQAPQGSFFKIHRA